MNEVLCPSFISKRIYALTFKSDRVCAVKYGEIKILSWELVYVVSIYTCMDHREQKTYITIFSMSEAVVLKSWWFFKIIDQVDEFK